MKFKHIISIHFDKYCLFMKDSMYKFELSSLFDSIELNGRYGLNVENDFDENVFLK